MPSKRLLFFVLFVAVLIGVSMRLPATLITERIQQPGLQINGVAGTIWNGEVSGLVVNGEPVAPIQWKLRPSALLRGSLSGDVVVTPTDSEIRATADMALNGDITLSDVVIDGQLRSIASGTSLGPIAGHALARLDEVVLVNNWPQRIVGQLTIADLRYPATANYSLGDFKLTCPGETAPEIVCQIEDQGGPLQLNGQIELSEARQYRLTGQIKARTEANAEIRNSLAFIGQPLNDGSYSLEWSGGLD